MKRELFITIKHIKGGNKNEEKSSERDLVRNNGSWNGDRMRK